MREKGLPRNDGLLVTPGLSGLEVEIVSAGVRLGGVHVLRDISWQLAPGERWALIGANGAGKSCLLGLVHGDLWPDQAMGGSIHRRLNGASVPLAVCRPLMALVSPAVQAVYLREERGDTVLDCLIGGARGTRMPSTPVLPEEREAALAFLERLRAASPEALGDMPELAERPVAELSLGQGRRVLLARALYSGARLLLLDEALDGLDPAARGRFLGMLETAAERKAGHAPGMVMTAHRRAELAACLDHALVLDSGRIVSAGGMGVADGWFAGFEAAPPPAPVPVASGAGNPIVRLERASVVRRGRAALRGIDWTLRRGEVWLVHGPNGAGKSTLLGLLAGDLHPYPTKAGPTKSGGGVVRFEATGRETRFNLWDVRRRARLVSLELDVRFHDAETTALEAVLTGPRGHLGTFVPPEEGQEAIARAQLARVGVADLAGRTLATLSSGQRRRVMLARALMPAGNVPPELLLLDEPCAGLDPQARRNFLTLLAELAAQGLGVVMASHHPEDEDILARLPAARRASLTAGVLAVENAEAGGLSPQDRAWLVDLTERAGREIMAVYETDFEVVVKADESPVTRADLTAQALVARELAARFPDIPLVGEESAPPPYEERRGWQRFFLLDPLDGTREFVKRNGQFSVNLALVQDGRPVFGIIHAPAMGVTWHGGPGLGAFRREGGPEGAGGVGGDASGRRILCRPPAPGQGHVALVSVSHFSPEMEAILARFRIAERRPMGSAIKYGLIAEGTATLYPRLGGTCEWDVAAGHAILEGAGGSFTTLDGEPFPYNTSTLRNGPFLATASPLS